MNRREIMQIAARELSDLKKTEETDGEIVFRRPTPEDEIDHLGRQLVKRMIETGVIEP